MVFSVLFHRGLVILKHLSRVRFLKPIFKSPVVKQVMFARCLHSYKCCY